MRNVINVRRQTVGTFRNFLDPLLPQTLHRSVVKISQNLMRNRIPIDRSFRKSDCVMSYAELSYRRKVAVLSRQEVRVRALDDESEIFDFGQVGDRVGNCREFEGLVAVVVVVVFSLFKFVPNGLLNRIFGVLKSRFLII